MEDKKYIIYKHTFPNGKIYIGKTCQNPLYRWKNNGKGYDHNKEMYNDIQVYGWNNIIHEILYENLTKEEASELEYKLVNDNKDICYNKVIGGDGYFVFVDGEKMYLSDIAKNKELNPLNLTKEEIRNRLFNHLNSRTFTLEKIWHRNGDKNANICWIIKKSREFQKNIYFCFID